MNMDGNIKNSKYGNIKPGRGNITDKKKKKMWYFM